MVTTRAGPAKKTSADLDDGDDGFYSGDNDNNDSMNSCIRHNV